MFHVPSTGQPRRLSPRRVSVALVLGALAGCSVRAPRVTRTTESGPDAANGRPGIYYALPRTVLQARIAVTRTDTVLTPLGMAVAGYEEATLRPRKVALEDAKEKVKKAAKALESLDPKASETDKAEKQKKYAEALKAQSDALKELLEGTSEDKDVGGWSLRQLGIDLTALIGGRTRFAIQEAKLGMRAEADPKQVFHVALDGGALEERSMTLLMSELGLLSGAKFEVTDKTPEVAVKVIKSAGSLVGTIIKGAVAPAAKSQAVKDVDGHAVLPVRALELAQWLATLHEERRAFLKASSGSNLTDVSKDTWLEVLAEYKRREADILEQFRTTEKVEGTIVVEWRPSECEGCGRVLPILWFSETKGLQALLPGVDVPQELADAGHPGVPSKDAKPIGLQLEIDPREQMAASIPSEPAGLPGERSLHYRIPAVARVRIGEMKGSILSAPLASELVSVAQLGVVGALPTRVSGSGLTYDAEIYSALGALKKVEIRTKAATGAGDVAEAVGGAVETGLKADAARTNALREPSNLTQLETYRKELEEQKKIRDLENELGITPPTPPTPTGP